jgi:cyclohexa-1,5-dienecarbonyl-CoA hydratase
MTDTLPLAYEHLRLEREAGVARLVLRRPPLNVLNLAMLEELDVALAQVGDDDRVKVLVLSGEGKAFCAGADVGDHLPDRVERMLSLFHSVVKRLMELPCPTVAAVHGAALGGGCELVLACDLVLARDDAAFGQPEIRLGVFPPVAAALLSRRIPRAAAYDLVLTGRSVGPDEALRLGLVSRVASAEAFEGLVRETVERLTGLSGPVLRLTKRAMREAEEAAPTDAIDGAERLYLRELMNLTDAHEGLAAFMEKRAPKWKES